MVPGGMGVQTMMAGSMRNILLGAIEIKKEEYDGGKSIEDIEKELLNEKFSKQNIKRILTEVQNQPITDDIEPSQIRDHYKIKQNTIKMILRQKPNFKMQDVVRFEGKDYVIQQINDFGSEAEMIIKYYG